VEEADQGFFGDEAGAAVSVLQRLLPVDSRSRGPVE
jgi:hypothetical protein